MNVPGIRKQRFGTKRDGVAEVCRVLTMMVKENRNG